MQITIPEFINDIALKFSENNFTLFLVGGSLRNILLEKQVKDWDLTTNATPEQILSLFPEGFYDNVFGTVGIPLMFNQEKIVVEITTFRTEEGYANNRHPDKVSWGKTIEEDLSRRDFTINAMALELQPRNIRPLDVTSDSIIDPYNGRKDLDAKLIRAVGDPNERFKEDALRLMRAIRFATQLSFTIEEDTLSAVTNDATLIKNISQERIRDEFMKILGSDYPFEGIMILKNTGILTFILPELLEGVGISQKRPGRHHTTDVFEHNVFSLKFCPSKDPLVRFATLIHDVGKPRVATPDRDGLVIFHNHEIVGSKMAYEICDRLRFSRRDREKVAKLIRWHMFTVDEHITDSAVRRFIRRIGVENVKDMMDLRIGDRLGGGTQTAESWRLTLFKKRVEVQLAPLPFSTKDLAVDGNDLMSELGIKPGREVGDLLQKLFEEVDEDLSKNTREFLLTRVKELV
ncbi:MAG: HD domain-containing protein [Candidatus Levybacteria bacterium]|nr:HD domain-containing protein [Candidatus Levybacteria bacterium]